MLRLVIAFVVLLLLKLNHIDALHIRSQQQNQQHHKSRIRAVANAVKQQEWFQSISTSYARRVAADPTFPQKSITELLLAAGTQLTAEWNRRGAQRLIPELDFVIGGVLTAMAGKYYSMWRVAPTLTATNSNDDNNDDDESTSSKTITTTTTSTASSDKTDELRLGNMLVPTNAFQSTMSDGITRPTTLQRLGALIAPMPYLFRAGVISSAFGYGLTAAMIGMRSILLPSYQPETVTMNIVYASLYTGGFLAIVSNVRYQILQGIIEPKFVNRFYQHKLLYTILSVSIRLGNGFLGSMLGIMGMRKIGLQRIKH